MKKLIFYSALLMILTVSCHKNPNDNDVIPTENLVAYYPFNGNANDESGHLNNGTVHGATLTEDRFGNPNRAYYFDGINDFIEAQHSESLDIVGPITICVWIKPDPNFHSWIGIISKAQRDTKHRDGYLTTMDPYQSYGMNINFDWYKKGATVSNSTTLLNDNKWHFLVGVYDRNSIRLYFDGKVDNSIPCTQDMPHTAENLLIGNDYWRHVNTENQITNAFFKGSLDDIRIYNCALSEKVINALYKESSNNQ